MNDEVTQIKVNPQLANMLSRLVPKFYLQLQADTHYIVALYETKDAGIREFSNDHQSATNPLKNYSLERSKILKGIIKKTEAMTESLLDSMSKLTDETLIRIKISRNELIALKNVSGLDILKSIAYQSQTHIEFNRAVTFFAYAMH